MSKSIDFRPVVLAGGSGTRFWPRSRRARAKQVLALDGERSMIQQTVERLKPLAGLDLPFAPEQPIECREENDRPQPRLDRNRGKGMTVTVGRLRPCNLLDWKFVLLSHNTVRGAAGATILNAEMLASLGKFESVAAASARA